MNDCTSQPNQLNGEYTAHEKAADVVWRIANGQAVTVREVADDFGITWQGAWKMMNTISRVIPIAPNSTGRWQRFDIR